MTVQQAANYLEWPVAFLREAIDQGKVDFGIAVRMPGSKRRTFRINEERIRKWKNGKK